MFKIFRKIFQKKNHVYYIANGTEILPEKLSATEEYNLVEQMKNGSEEAKNQLIERNLRLVVYIAKKFDNTGTELEDLISVGAIGLIKAVQSFKNSVSLIEAPISKSLKSYPATLVAKAFKCSSAAISIALNASI